MKIQFIVGGIATAVMIAGVVCNGQRVTVDETSSLTDYQRLMIRQLQYQNQLSKSESHWNQISLLQIEIAIRELQKQLIEPQLARPSIRLGALNDEIDNLKQRMNESSKTIDVINEKFGEITADIERLEDKLLKP